MYLEQLLDRALQLGQGHVVDAAGAANGGQEREALRPVPVLNRVLQALV